MPKNKKQKRSRCPYCQKLCVVSRHLEYCNSHNSQPTRDVHQEHSIQETASEDVNQSEQFSLMDDPEDVNQSEQFPLMDEQEVASEDEEPPPNNQEELIEEDDHVSNSSSEDPSNYLSDQPIDDASSGGPSQEEVSIEDIVSESEDDSLASTNPLSTKFRSVEIDANNPIDDNISDMQSKSVVEQVFPHLPTPNIPTEITIDINPSNNNNNNDPRFLNLKIDNPHLGVVLEKPVDSPEYNMWKLQCNTTLSMLRLIDYCDQRPSSNRRFLDGLLKILVEEMRDRDFDPAKAPTRETVTQNIIKRYGFASEPVVTQFKVTSIENPYLVSDHNALHSRKRDILYCITFHVEKNMIDLFSDRGIFGNLNNLVVNPDDPFAPYQGHGDEILAGSWYKDTIVRLKNSEFGFDEYFEFLIPIILYVDKTGTTDNQRYPLEPFIFTLGIIRRALRANPRAWRPAGFIPDLESKSTYENKYTSSKNPGAIPQSYHRFLDLILEGFQQVQDKGIITWLRLGDKVKNVRI